MQTENPVLTLAKAINNLEKIARQTSKLNWYQGKEWYKQAHLYACSLAEYLKDGSLAFRIEKACGVIAALSPQCSWPENMRAARALIQYGETGSTTCYPANINKAKRILAGERSIDVLGGLKVRAFYDNILNYQSSLSVTIDTHAARATFNKIVLDAKELSWIFRKPGNTLLQTAYITVARKYKVMPCVLQAAIWLRVKDVINNDASLDQLSLYNK